MSTLNNKKFNLTNHFEENKDKTSELAEIIKNLLEERKIKFDFSAALSLTPPTTFRKEVIFKSNSAGVADWKYPAEKDLDWNNHLTGIINLPNW